MFAGLPNDLIIKILNDRKEIKKDDRYKRQFNEVIDTLNIINNYIDKKLSYKDSYGCCEDIQNYVRAYSKGGAVQGLKYADCYGTERCPGISPYITLSANHVRDVRHWNIVNDLIPGNKIGWALEQTRINVADDTDHRLPNQSDRYSLPVGYLQNKLYPEWGIKYFETARIQGVPPRADAGYCP